MKALLLNSSYRKTGNTATVLSAFKNELIESGFSVESLNLAHQDLKPCRGCRICFDSGEHKCPIQDDMPGILAMIQDSDIVFFATPIYVEDVNGTMKTLIDRLAYNSHRPKFFNQYAYIILTSGIGATNHAVSTLRKACHTWGFRLVGYSKYVAGEAISESDFVKKYGFQVKNEVKRIKNNSCKSNTPPFINLLTFEIQKCYYNNNSNKETYDYKYWCNNKWLEKSMNYYYHVELSLFKKLLINISGKVIAKLVLK